MGLSVSSGCIKGLEDKAHCARQTRQIKMTTLEKGWTGGRGGSCLLLLSSPDNLVGCFFRCVSIDQKWCAFILAIKLTPRKVPGVLHVCSALSTSPQIMIGLGHMFGWKNNGPTSLLYVSNIGGVNSSCHRLMSQFCGPMNWPYSSYFPPLTYFQTESEES